MSKTDQGRGLGLASLKVEGAETPFDAAFPETADQKAVRKKTEAQARTARAEFEQGVANMPNVLTPGWVATQYRLAEIGGSREAITYLRRLVLWRTAAGMIKQPDMCARIVMPEDEKPYSDGW